MHRITEPLIQLMSYKALCCFTWETRERQFLQKRIDRCKNVQGWSFKTDRWRPIIFQFFLFKPQNLIFTVVFHQFKTKHRNKYPILNQQPIGVFTSLFPFEFIICFNCLFRPKCAKMRNTSKIASFSSFGRDVSNIQKKVEKVVTSSTSPIISFS